MTPLDPRAFVNDFYAEIQAKRVAELEELGMEEIKSSRGWLGWEMPDSRWRDSYHPSVSVANYKSWPHVAPGWIIQVRNGGNNVAMLRRKAATEMADMDWAKLIKRIENVKHNYPLVDDFYHSEVENDYQSEAWNETYRKEFQNAMENKFDGVFAGMQHGDAVEAKFADMISNDQSTDKFFYDYMNDRWQGGEWTEHNDGSMSIDVNDIVRGIDTNDVMEYLAPEDPRQMRFQFARESIDLVNALLQDDYMMLDSPLANKIVDTLLEETEGVRKYSCLMIDLPEELGQQVMAWGQLNIRDEDVYVDEGGKGRETAPHLTVLYGLFDEKPSDALLQVFEHTPPFEVELGPCSLFRNGKYDVLKMAVVSPFLYALNRNVQSVVAYENDYPEYKPHVTIAYVKPGTCDRLEGMSPWDNEVQMGQTTLEDDGNFTAKEVIFSSTDGTKQAYSFGMTKSTAKTVESAEDDMDKFVRDSGAADIAVNKSHRSMRRVVGRHLIDKVEIWHDPVADRTVRGWSDGRIRITYRANGRADAERLVWDHEWGSFNVLKWTLRNWRNLYGAPLFIDGQPAGKVEYRNPALAE